MQYWITSIFDLFFLPSGISFLDNMLESQEQQNTGPVCIMRKLFSMLPRVLSRNKSVEKEESLDTINSHLSKTLEA